MLLLMFLIHETSQSLSFSNAKLLTEMESLAVVQGVWRRPLHDPVTPWYTLVHFCIIKTNVISYIFAIFSHFWHQELIWPPLGRRPGKIWICEANSRIFPVPSAKGWAFYFLSVFFFPQYDHLEGAHSFAQFLGQIFRLRGFWCKSRNTYRDRFYTLGRCSNLAAKQPWR